MYGLSMAFRPPGDLFPLLTTLPPINCVINAAGQTYEREMILEWLRRGHKSSPLTAAPLRHTNVTANLCLRSMILDFRERNPSLGPPLQSDHRRQTMLAAVGNAEAHTKRLTLLSVGDAINVNATVRCLELWRINN
jgi:hypothetical protein